MDTLNLETLNWSLLDDFDAEMRDWAGENDAPCVQPEQLFNTNNFDNEEL